MKLWTSVSAALLLALLGTAAHAQILIGQSAGFSGPVAAGVKETTDGARLYLNAVNAKGGINGQKIELVSMDDKFDPKLAAENARVLIEEKEVVAMFLTRGTPHTEAMLPLLDKHGVSLVGPSTGAMVLHQPVKKHVFNVRATYQREAEKAITHLASVGVTRIALVHVDDSFGADGLEFTLGYWVTDPENGAMNLRSAINKSILASLREHGIEIPYPQRVVHNR